MNFDLLVNKDNKLPFTYIPSDLVIVYSKYDFIRDQKLSLYAYKEFIKLQEKLRKDGLNICITSGYRNALKQMKIYNYYYMTIGAEMAKKRVALPGRSEHQTGLAVDLCVIENDIKRDITMEESNYLKDNAYKYGFILRYPKGSEHITSFNYEPWHFRYVGDISEFIYENDITLEEYHEKILKK